MEEDQVTFLISGGEPKPIITVPTSSTIFQLKKKIAEHTGVPVGRQNLLYGNTKLLDFATFNHYNFGTIAEIFLAVDLYPDERVINITVSSPAFKIGLRVNKVHKVIQMKQEVGQTWGIDTKDFTLWYMSVKLKDDIPLYKYYVTEGSDIQFTRTGFCT